MDAMSVKPKPTFMGASVLGACNHAPRFGDARMAADAADCAEAMDVAPPARMRLSVVVADPPSTSPGVSATVATLMGSLEEKTSAGGTVTPMGGTHDAPAMETLEEDGAPAMPARASRSAGPRYVVLRSAGAHQGREIWRRTA